MIFSEEPRVQVWCSPNSRGNAVQQTL